MKMTDHVSAGISPFFDSHGPSPDAPEGCVVIAAAILARHSSITMNDDECVLPSERDVAADKRSCRWPETMGPFIEKLESYDTSKISDDSSLSFLKDWATPVNEENMEELTKPGATDAEAFGKRMKMQYEDLLPSHRDPPFK